MKALAVPALLLSLTFATTVRADEEAALQAIEEIGGSVRQIAANTEDKFVKTSDAIAALQAYNEAFKSLTEDGKLNVEDHAKMLGSMFNVLNKDSFIVDRVNQVDDKSVYDRGLKDQVVDETRKIEEIIEDKAALAQPLRP